MSGLYDTLGGPAPALWLETSPPRGIAVESLIAKLGVFDVLAVPLVPAAVPLTVRAPPVGAVVSDTNVSVVVALVLPAASAEVNPVPVLGALAPEVQE